MALPIPRLPPVTMTRLPVSSRSMGAFLFFLLSSEPRSVAKEQRLELAARQAEGLPSRALERQAREKQGQRHDVFRLFEPFRGLALQDARHTWVCQARVHGTGDQLIDEDVTAAKLLRDDAREHPRRGLRAGIRRAVRPGL